MLLGSSEKYQQLTSADERVLNGSSSRVRRAAPCYFGQTRHDDFRDHVDRLTEEAGIRYLGI
jgi:hypothetical protein